jgi:hypothetical protein
VIVPKSFDDQSNVDNITLKSSPNNYAFNFKQLQSHTGDQSV